MNSPLQTAAPGPLPLNMTSAMLSLFALCCGAIVANIYYAQPIIGLIAPDIHMSDGVASLIVSLTQIGYALGLFFVVPLGDLLENRRLMIGTALVSVISLAAAAVSTRPDVFLLVSLLIGFGSVSVQLLIPLAAHLSPEASRGRVVGGIMSGLLLGILLARPLSSFIADYFGWRAVFGAAAVLMVAITLVLATTMSSRQPDHKASYLQLLRSLATLMANTPLLRHRAFYQACMFATFSLFWTAVPLELAQRYGLSQTQIAIFALVGATGAIAAPLSGRWADAGHTRRATLAALAIGGLSYLPALAASALGIGALVVTGIVLDFCVQTNMVLGQREIYALDAAARNRLNALYMTSIFVGGAVGSAIASGLYQHGGWAWVSIAGATFPAIALIHFLLNRRARG